MDQRQQSWTVPTETLKKVAVPDKPKINDPEPPLVQACLLRQQQVKKIVRKELKGGELAACKTLANLETNWDAQRAT